MTTPRWYMVNKMGMATLCANKADAQQEAADAQSLWPDMGPHRAVQLVEAAQQESFDRSPQATSIEEAARDVGKWLNERPNRPIDLRHVAMLCAHATAAPQQEAQEPVAWYVTGCGRLLDEDEAKAEARHIGGTARAIPVYTVPQPSPASQGDALDAARYRYLRDGDWREHEKLESVIRLQLNTLWDETIDAARAAQDGGDVAMTTTAAPAQAADSVLEDAARLDWLLLHISGAEFRRIGVHYSGNARRADVDAARKQGGAA